MTKEDLIKKLNEKQDYMEKLKVEINAISGMIIMLKELIKESETPTPVVEAPPKE